jgi:FRG domain
MKSADSLTFSELLAKLNSFAAAKLSDGTPRYLLRGQAKHWYSEQEPEKPLITPTIGRLKNLKVQQQALDVCRHAKLLGLGLFGHAIKTHEQAVGLLRHYEWPTPAIDFSEDPSVALTFAHDGYTPRDDAIMIVADRKILQAEKPLLTETELWFTPFPVAQGGLNTRFILQSGWLFLPNDWKSSDGFHFDLADPQYGPLIAAHYAFQFPAGYQAPHLNLMTLQNDSLPWRVQDVVRIFVDERRKQGKNIDPEIDALVNKLAGPLPLPADLTMQTLSKEVVLLPRWHALSFVRRFVEMILARLFPHTTDRDPVLAGALDYIRDACRSATPQPKGHDHSEVQAVARAAKQANDRPNSARAVFKATAALISTAQIYEWNNSADHSLQYALAQCIEAMTACQAEGLLKPHELPRLQGNVLQQFALIHRMAQECSRRECPVDLP